MQQGDNTGRFGSNPAPNPQYGMSNETQSSPQMLTAAGISPQPPPYPGTQQLPSMTRTFSQRHMYSDFQTSPIPYQGQSIQSPSYSVGSMPNQNYNLQVAGNGTSQSLSPGAMAMQANVHSLSPGGLPRKSLAGMMSPIRSQNQHHQLNMPPPSSPVVMGGRVQGPLSPIGVYMSKSPSPQRRTSVSHIQSAQSRTYPPQSPVYHQTPMYPYSPRQQSVIGQQSSPVPSPMYVDPSAHGQLSPMITAQQQPCFHSPKVQIPRSPYKAARHLNMSASPSIASQYVGPSQQQWQYAGNTPAGQQEMWENVNVPPSVVPLPVLSSDTLDLLSTLTVSTVSSPVHVPTSMITTESQLPKSSLLQQHLLMPATPIRTPTTDGNLLAIAAENTVTSSQTIKPGVRPGKSKTGVPPSRSNSKQSGRPSQSLNLEEKVLNCPNKVKVSLCSTIDTMNSSIMTPVCPGKTDTDSRGEIHTAPSHTVSNIETKVPSTTMGIEYGAKSLNDMKEQTNTVGNEQVIAPEILERRRQLCEIYRTKLQDKLSLYKECLTELFFLQNGGNFMDYSQFKKRPSSKLVDYLKSKLPDSRQCGREIRKLSNDSSSLDPMSPASDASSTGGRKSSRDECKKLRRRSMSHEESRGDAKQKKIYEKASGIRRSLSKDDGESSDGLQVSKSGSLSVPQLSRPASRGQSPMRLKRLAARQATPAQLDESIGSQEEILERAKQEAVIQRKVVELRKQGLWTQRRLPKVQEPPRNKTHWDYLLEEMRWLAADFAQERKWKRAAARKLARAVTAYHKEQHDQERRAKREEQNRLRRIAATMAREVRIFWGNVGKVVEYKQRSLLDEKRQKALDLHLSYIVDQTEKYSDWLTQGLNKPNTTSIGSASPSQSSIGLKDGSDDDFLPQGGSSDDEETIAVAERDFGKEEEDEVSILKKESELPFNELLDSLPPEVIENIGKPLEEKDSGQVESKLEPEVRSAQDSCDEAGVSKPNSISLRRSARKRKPDSIDEKEAQSIKRVKSEEKDEDDEEFDAKNDGDHSDDEATIAMEEEQEKVDHKKELEDLQAEGDMPIEELMKMYGSAFDSSPDDDDNSEEVEEEDISEIVDEEEEKNSESEEEQDDDEPVEDEEIGMDYLLKADLTKDDNTPMILPAERKDDKDREGSPSKEITDVAAEAASLQPTGFTLATTQVVTPIPILLKHTLREYQHIGLDWLVTMYNKRLNGILADEMGLGKTIQTIALLAHLACDKGVWGPHLIVVPTSVMLNWEMEFKKWCPGFKILTYYGSQKERKAKRTGWTKSNAFHVCITSYKLVLQDNASFRRKKWKYLILDEAQNIKNFKSQRWQTLLNFNSQRRLLLTGTPLQNNLMELWSLMHFLMPHVFQSHKEFKEWFSNPLTGMIEGGQEYNEKLVRRLHKVLRPFLLRRIKKDVEKQMPNKYEHVVRCHLSKRQRFLYDDFMSQASTKDTLESGHFMSVINILMQLRKVCNHPNLFEPRPIVSPFYTDQITHYAPSLVTKALEKDPLEAINLQDYHMHLPSLTNIRQTHAELLRRCKTPRKLIEEMPENRLEVVKPELEEPPKLQSVREHLSNLVKEREKLRGKNVPHSLHLLHSGQSVASLPLLSIPISSNSLQLSSNTGHGSSRVITLPKSEDSSGNGRTAASQSFTLQYQTPQGTRVAIPNKQIRQLPGGVVQIVTPGAVAKATNIQAPATLQSNQVNGSDVQNQSGKVASSVGSGKSGPERSVSKTGGGDIELLDVKDPASYAEYLRLEFKRQHRERCLRMANENDRRCNVTPCWISADTIDLFKNMYKRPDQDRYQRNRMKSDALLELIKTEKTRLKELKPITDRFAFNIPTVESKQIVFHVSHPSPSKKLEENKRNECLQKVLKAATLPYHSINLSMKIQFPEARLIQYDCGKLQVLDVLLRRFWTEKHKCLIFTQMTKVLDVLEAFLSYHGYRYLRLDGSTKVEQRMLLMERFNNDARIFCFILSTRSGGIGVNLTGADTVIFYDSDWNPTMDAQAQDRCHRIGQTRDVHIYRLISERTVEENILKKANQKRLLGDIAIEGGSFTTAFFKEQALKDLFNEPTGLEELPSNAETKSDSQTTPSLSKPVTARQKAIAAAKENEAKDPIDDHASSAKRGSTWIDALQQTEDKEDVDAAKQLREEQDADMDEFIENGDGEEAVEGSRVHEEMKLIYEELTPIEKYALRYLEETTEEINREELELAEEEVHRSKQDWELAHLVALKEEEERRLEEEEDEIFYTREDSENQVYIDDVSGDRMPIWFPPTPPQEDNDVYVDPIASLLYVPGPMSEDLLPPILTKKERKRTRTESESPGSLANQRRKQARIEFHAPKSLFNRPQSFKKSFKPSKPRRDASSFTHVKISSRPPTVSVTDGGDKDSASGNALTGTALQTSSIGTSSTAKSVATGTESSKNPEWLINEDLKLLMAIQQVLEMPLSLSVMMPAHTPNWDLVADIVNSVSSVYRSPKMCKERFENDISPREEGKPAMDISLIKKKKVSKTPSKQKVVKTQKTTSMHNLDNNAQCSLLYSNRFDITKEMGSKRAPPTSQNPAGLHSNPEHIEILKTNGIAYDNPLPPDEVATLRASRIQREKDAAKQQHIAQSQALHAVSAQQISAGQPAKPGVTPIGQLTAIPLSGSSTANIIVNSAFKKINQSAVAKSTLTATTLQQTLLRTVSTGDQTQLQQHQQQIQIQPQGQASNILLQRLASSGSSSVIGSGAGTSNTITLSSLTKPSITLPGAIIQGQGSQQLAKQLTKQQRLSQVLAIQKSKKPGKSGMTPQKLQITPEAMKKLRQQSQAQPQQIEANVVTVAKVSGKPRKQITQQQLEFLLKSPNVRRATTSKSQNAQVQIAPVHAQVQAQQVQEAAAQQAAQHVVTSKPLPITVPVSNLVSVAAVNLSAMGMPISNAGTSSKGKAIGITGQQMHITQQMQRQILKQCMVTQHQGQAQLPAQQAGQILPSKVGVNKLYAMVSPSPLTTQNKRRVTSASVSQVVSNQQVQATNQPVLTVTKLLNPQGQGVTMKQPIAQGAEALVQQVRQQSGGTQLQIRQISQLTSNQQPTQMILTPTSNQQFIQRQSSQNIVASLSISAAASTASASQQQMTVSQASNLSQQLQGFLNPAQVIRTPSQGSIGNQNNVQNIGQHIVLQQQQTIPITTLNPTIQITSGASTQSLVVPVSVTSTPANAQLQAQVTTVSTTTT